MIFGDKTTKAVVPFGELWRTGANRATKVSFGEDVKIMGNALKAGEYALYTIPGKLEWEVIFNKGVTNGGTSGYKTEEDVLRFKVKPMMLPAAFETFTMQVANITPNTCEIQIMWEKTGISIPVVADVETKVLASIDQLMNKDNHPYHAAAQYYFDNGKDLKQALDWESKAVEQNPDAFWMFHLKAKIQAKLGDKAGATETAKKSIELAKKAQNNDYVKMNEDLIATLK